MSWLERLEHLDPSLLTVLAALVKDGGQMSGLPLTELMRGYRETLVEYHGDDEHVDSPGFHEYLLEQLQGVVLPQLVSGGWIKDSGDQGWDRVIPTGEWWGEAILDRRASTRAILDRAFPQITPITLISKAARVVGGSVLRCEGLNKAFKRRRVVRDVSLELAQGEVIGLLGPNGAGKTTTFYLITGLIGPDSGRILMDGRDITNLPMYRRARAGIGYLAQEPSVFRKLTVEQNVLAILETLGLSRGERQQRLERLLDELSIKHLRKHKAYSLSGGERRRLEITRALVTRPKFMLLDEPFAGVDPIAVHDIQTIVGGLRHRGLGVVITDHNVEQTLEIVDRAYIMFEGSVQASGTVRELVFNEQVADLYLGPTLTARLRARMEKTA
jgi:lipopolysaccharide export system ATP-binding protein